MLIIMSCSSYRFVCDNPADLEELVESLHAQGVRESVLKGRIQNRWIQPLMNKTTIIICFNTVMENICKFNTFYLNADNCNNICDVPDLLFLTGTRISFTLSISPVRERLASGHVTVMQSCSSTCAVTSRRLPHDFRREAWDTWRIM